MKMNKTFNVKGMLCLSLLLTLFICSSAQEKTQQVLKHVVSFQFKEGVSEESKTQAIQIFRDLTDKIPEIKKFEGGENLNNGELSKGFTHCFILTFESEADRDIYLPHPAHMNVVEKNKPLFSDLLVFDFWGEE